MFELRIAYNIEVSPLLQKSFIYRNVQYRTYVVKIAKCWILYMKGSKLDEQDPLLILFEKVKVPTYKNVFGEIEN